MEVDLNWILQLGCDGLSVSFRNWPSNGQSGKKASSYKIAYEEKEKRFVQNVGIFVRSEARNLMFLLKMTR